MRRNTNGKHKRDWPDVHVRIEREAYRMLTVLARKDSRSLASQATYLLNNAILSYWLKTKEGE